ncbi:hypothetical protein F4802DRAFT_571752 [Xylaria palmicola]|nr:hypothetical protein F4802DRAFT_571752 [Xylaria palmicola]
MTFHMMALTQRNRRRGRTMNATYNDGGDAGIDKSNLNRSNTVGSQGRETGKRQRSRDDENPPAACDQCRSRKVRCDRQQPECSNCQKAAVFCSWSSTSRRVNHAKQLREDFSSVVDHLDKVHQTLNQLASLTQIIVAQPYCHSRAPIHSSSSYDIQCTAINGGNASTGMVTATSVSVSPSPRLGPATTTFLHGLQDMNPFSLSNVNEAIPELSGKRDTECTFLRESSLVSHDGQRISESSGYLAAMKDVADQISCMINCCHGDNGPYAPQDVGVQAALQHLRDHFPFTGPSPSPNIIADNQPVSVPPRLMVDLFIKNFLCSYNMLFPVFDRAELGDAVDAFYAADQQIDNSPWALIFTNIIVLGLGREAQTASVSKSHPKSMHHELISSFLRNCDRAITNLDSFTRPSIANIQALLTLALVGREFYEITVFEKACQTACHLARIMGLHRNGIPRDTVQCSERDERERLFKVLYTLDKCRTFLTGRPCDLYLFDSEIHLEGRPEDQSPSSKLDSAFHHLMYFWEEIYLGLYSTRSSLADAQVRTRRVSTMSDLATNWAQQHSGLFEPVDADSGLDVYRQLELKYCYHITQVLILRCDQINHVQRQVLDHARACLRVVVGIIGTPMSSIALSYLGRLLQNYSIVPFTELLRFHLHNLGRVVSVDEGISEDVELLRYINHSVQALQHPNLPQPYLSQLGLGLDWLFRVLAIIAETPHGSYSAPDGPRQLVCRIDGGSSNAHESSHAASPVTMQTSDDGVAAHRSSSLASISPPSEKQLEYTIGKDELAALEVSTPLTDHMGTTVGHRSSSNSSVYYEEFQFDTSLGRDRSWDVGMDTWEGIFPLEETPFFD